MLKANMIFCAYSAARIDISFKFSPALLSKTLIAGRYTIHTAPSEMRTFQFFVWKSMILFGASKEIIFAFSSLLEMTLSTVEGPKITRYLGISTLLSKFLTFIDKTESVVTLEFSRIAKICS